MLIQRITKEHLFGQKLLINKNQFHYFTHFAHFFINILFCFVFLFLYYKKNKNRLNAILEWKTK